MPSSIETAATTVATLPRLFAIHCLYNMCIIRPSDSRSAGRPDINKKRHVAFQSRQQGGNQVGIVCQIDVAVNGCMLGRTYVERQRERHVSRSDAEAALAANDRVRFSSIVLPARHIAPDGITCEGRQPS